MNSVCTVCTQPAHCRDSGNPSIYLNSLVGLPVCTVRHRGEKGEGLGRCILICIRINVLKWIYKHTSADRCFSPPCVNRANRQTDLLTFWPPIIRTFLSAVHAVCIPCRPISNKTLNMSSNTYQTHTPWGKGGYDHAR